MTDWRGLCAELLQALETEGYAHWTVTPDKDELCLRTRAALAQPEPEGPTDDELDIAVIAIQRLAPYQPDGPTQPTHDIYAVDRGREILKQHLARYARPAIKPVPVCERLPGPEDCDAEGRCWYLHIKEDGVVAWFKQRPTRISRCSIYHLSHWLPHYALPTSQESPS